MIVTVGINDELLNDVKLLGKKNARTLGMFPDGAYNEYAQRKGIIAATENNQLLGYVLFRVTQYNRMVSIAHLCINPDQRRNGIASQLLDAIKERYCNSVNGIGLSCRKDYIEASNFWTKYGFKPMQTSRSRSKDEKYLIKWVYDFGNHDLFSALSYTTRKINALLDANILIKMRDQINDDNIDAISLNADWLQEEAEYYYAPEIYSEINRDLDKDRSEKSRKFLQHFIKAHFKPDDSEKIFIQLSEILSGNSINDISDRKQLSECIAAKLEYFITLDERLLSHGQSLFERYQLKVLRPIDFILLIDQLRNSKDYLAYRVAGAHYEYKKLSSENINRLVDTFVFDRNGENKSGFRNMLVSIATDVKDSSVRLVTDSSDHCIAFFAATIQAKKLFVPALRTYKNKIAEILFQQLVYDIIQLAIKQNLPTILIVESHLNEDQILVLISFGFFKTDKGWLKVAITGIYSLSELITSSSFKEYLSLKELFNQDFKNLEGSRLDNFKYKLERKLWPCKLSDYNIPVYIIPIRPHWSAQLFDHYASNQSLFGCKPEIAWSKENIYYRSARPVSECAPAKILWYVSNDSACLTGRSGGIVACSYLEEVTIGPAKEMYQQFKNYGIYEWSDIYKLSGKDIYKEIKTLRFSDTEVFKNIITYKKIGEILKKNEMAINTFTSPLKVSNVVFNEIYRLSQEVRNE